MPFSVQSHFSHVQFCVAPWTAACQSTLSMGFSRQEYWSRLPLPSPGNLPNPDIKPSLKSLGLVGRFFTTSNTSVSSGQFGHSVVSHSLRPHRLQHARPPCPSPAPRGLLKLMSIELVRSTNHLILCHPLLLLPSIFPNIRVFSNESALHIRWPQYWNFSFNISPSKEHSGLISFRMDCLDLLVVQGTLKRLLQQHSSKASILQCSTIFIVQLSHPYMTTAKTIALTRWTFFWQSNVSAF